MLIEPTPVTYLCDTSTDIVHTEQCLPWPSHPQTQEDEQARSDEEHRGNAGDQQAPVVLVDGIADLVRGRFDRLCHRGSSTKITLSDTIHATAYVWTRATSYFINRRMQNACERRSHPASPLAKAAHVDRGIPFPQLIGSAGRAPSCQTQAKAASCSCDNFHPLHVELGDAESTRCANQNQPATNAARIKFGRDTNATCHAHTKTPATCLLIYTVDLGIRAACFDRQPQPWRDGAGALVRVILV